MQETRERNDMNRAFWMELYDAGLPLNRAADYVAETLDPDEVYSDAVLTKWAEKNGFVKAEKVAV